MLCVDPSQDAADQTQVAYMNIPGDPHAFQHILGQSHSLRLRVRPSPADDLRTHLPELPIASFLWPLIAEAVAEIPQPLRLGGVLQL